MLVICLIGYLCIGTIVIIWGAYDPISEQVDWSLSGGFGNPLLMWFICIIIFPILLPSIIRGRLRLNKHAKIYRKHNPKT